MSLPHAALGDLIGPTEWNALIDAANAATAALLLTPTKYTCTCASVSNTVTQTPIISFTVPAAAWSDSDLIEVLFSCLMTCTKGTDGQANLRFKVGAGSDASFGAPVIADGTAVQRLFSVYLMRKGALVYGYARPGHWTNIASGGELAGNGAGSSTPTNFTGSNIVVISVQLDAADAAFSVTSVQAIARHSKA